MSVINNNNLVQNNNENSNKISLQSFIDYLNDKNMSENCKTQLRNLITVYVNRKKNFFSNKKVSNIKTETMKGALLFLTPNTSIKYSEFIGHIVASKKIVKQVTNKNRNFLRGKSSSIKYKNLIEEIILIIGNDDSISKLQAKFQINKTYISTSMIKNKNISKNILMSLFKNKRIFKLYKLILLLTIENESKIVDNNSTIKYNNIQINLKTEHIGKNVTIFHFPEESIIFVCDNYKTIHKHKYSNNHSNNKTPVFNKFSNMINPLLNKAFLMPYENPTDDDLFKSELINYIIDSFLSELSKNSRSNFLNEFYNVLDILDFNILLNSKNLISFIIYSLIGSADNSYLTAFANWASSFNTNLSEYSKFGKKLTKDQKIAKNLAITLKEAIDLLKSSLGTSYFKLLESGYYRIMENINVPGGKKTADIVLSTTISLSTTAVQTAKAIYPVVKPALGPASVIGMAAVDFAITSYNDIKDFLNWICSPIAINKYDGAIIVDGDVYYDAVEAQTESVNQNTHAHSTYFDFD